MYFFNLLLCRIRNIESETHVVHTDANANTNQLYVHSQQNLCRFPMYAHTQHSYIQHTYTQHLAQPSIGSKLRITEKKLQKSKGNLHISRHDHWLCLINCFSFQFYNDSGSNNSDTWRKKHNNELSPMNFKFILSLAFWIKIMDFFTYDFWVLFPWFNRMKIKLNWIGLGSNTCQRASSR